MRHFLKFFFLAFLLCSADAHASGGAQQLNFTTGYSFRDVVNQTFASHYGWNSAQTVGASRMVFQGTNTPSRFDNSTVAWQIQHGDDPLSEGNNKERNEVLNMFGSAQTDESAASGTQYYALSVYIPSGWVDPNLVAGQWFIVAQCHGSDSNTGHSGQANFQFLLATNSNTANHYALRTVGGPITGGGSIPAPDDVITDLGPHVYDTWVDFVFKVTWGSDVDGTGHVTVYKRVVGTDATPVQIADYSAPNIYSSSGVNQATRYWKHGIYRGDDGTQGTVTVYTGPFVRASTSADAQLGAFGQYP